MPTLKSLALGAYHRLPPFMQDVAVSGMGARRKQWRYSGRQAEWEAFFRESGAWSEEQHLAYQREMLGAFVEHAARQVPWYRRRFRELGIDPSSIRGPEDLRRLPILDREDVRVAGWDLVADDVDRSRIWAHPSGGSTGMPITNFSGRDSMEVEYGFHWARRLRAVRPGMSYGTFSGNAVVPMERKKPPFWTNNWSDRQCLYSAFHLSEDTMAWYVDDMYRRPRDFYQGYPSVAYTLAEYMLRHGRRLFRPPIAFYSTSEVLQPVFRSAIERAFQCPVVDMYGQGEMSASITEYPCGHMHVDMDYGVVELHPVGEEDGLVLAEIIGTGFHNREWPLIRYRTGDLALYDPHETCAEGRPGQIIRAIHGRTAQFFELPNGHRILSLMGLSIHCRNTRSIQVIQERPGAIRIHTVPAPEFDDSDRQHMLKVFRGRLGDEIDIEIELAEQPVLTKGGKFLAILNRTQKA